VTQASAIYRFQWSLWFS